ncbi:MAG TPA: DEAD/DEAH box helicase [Patescibacteria group bacterium]|nr:DEAD/DEAH box helicase [Patescibacteria group bacterium]
MNIKIANKFFEQYEADGTIQNYIAQANSRYILYNADEPFENFPKYTPELDERCLHTTFAYLDFGWCFFNENHRDKAVTCMEKAGGILEHLFAYKLCKKKYKEYYSLTCALAYYVASQYSKSFIVLKHYTCETYLAKIIKLFLTRNFLRLEEILNEVQLEDRTNLDEEEKESFIYTKILADAILQILQYIFRGQVEALNNAKIILSDLINLSKINDESHLWWTFRLLYLVFEEYEESSLWTVLPPIIKDEERCKAYIYANLYKKTPIVELFKSQKECINKSLDSDDGFVVGMPTSSGKTKIAEISIVKTLSEYPDALCIYVAPFRSLANEIENSLSNVLSAMDYMVSNLYGSSQSTQIDRQMATEANVVIATPEKIKSILRSNPDLEGRIKLIIVDEGHLVGGQSRYITSELLIEEMKIVLKKNAGKLIMLSAVLPNLSDFSEWVSGNKDRMAQSTWRPSAQRFGELSFVKNTVNLRWEGNPNSFNNNFIEPKLIRAERETSTGKIYKAVYFPNDKKDATGSTAVKMLSMGSVLIYVGRSNMVLSQARVISRIFLEQNITHIWNNINDLRYVELTCEEAYGKDSEIYTLIKQGIVCHSSKLPTDVRQSIERLMSNGSPKIIIATSTLGQGVNIGISTVIISNVYLDQDLLVDVKDFWNIAGRAGRAFIDTEGKILYAICRDNDTYTIQKQIDLKNRYFQQENIEKAESGLFLLLRELFRISKKCGIDYELFLELLAENKEPVDAEKAEKFIELSSDLLDLLDDTLISMDIKNDVQGEQDCSAWIDDAFRGSLAYIQARRNAEFTHENVIDVLKARNKGVIKLAGPTQSWKAIACSSVPLKASIYIDQYLDELAESIQTYIQSAWDFEDLIELIKSLDSFIAYLPIEKDDRLIALVKTVPIREKWYAGSSLEEINKVSNKAIDVCNQYYGFYFPWIVNAISKKLNLIGKVEESSILENVSLLSEIGVPDIKSAKVYLAGIRSRECAIELSSFIDIDDDWLSTVKKQLFMLSELIEKEQIECSDNAHRWLDLLNLSDKHSSHQSLKKVVAHISYERTGSYQELLIVRYGDKIYISSFDYKVNILVHAAKWGKFEQLVGIQGLFFAKETDDLWVLKSRNPFVQIVEA